MFKKKLSYWIPFIALITVSAILINNMFYGFTWTDEGLYLSNTHRVFNGDKLIIDDWTPTQFYIPLIYPLYAIFIKINGSSEGCFLFFRVLTIIFQTATAFFAYFVLSKKYDKISSFFAAVLMIVFSRACINGPSYYTLGLITFFAGILCIYSFFEISQNKIFLFISGLFFAATTLCNPFLVIPYIFISLFCIFFPKSRKYINNIIFIWAGTILVGIAYLFFLFNGVSISDIITGLHYTYNDPSYKHSTILTIKRLIKMPRLLIFPDILKLSPLIFIYLFIKIKKIPLTQKKIFILHKLNTFSFLINIFTVLDQGSAVISFFSFTIFTILLLPNFKIKTFLIENKKELLYFVIPGFILAYFFCFASDTGYGVCAIGMTIAAIGEIFIYKRIIEKINFQTNAGISKTRILLPLIFLFIGTLFLRTNLTYRDFPLFPRTLFIPAVSKNIEKINCGPAKGLYTTADKKNQYESLVSVLNEIKSKNSNSSIFISGVATWAYISASTLRCAAPTTWRMFFDDYRLQLYYEEFSNHDFPDYVLLLDNKNPDNGHKYSEKNYEDNIKDTWLMKELVSKKYQKLILSCGILYKSPKIKS